MLLELGARELLHPAGLVGAVLTAAEHSLALEKQDATGVVAEDGHLNEGIRSDLCIGQETRLSKHTG